jgi:hypothetical protein
LCQIALRFVSIAPQLLNINVHRAMHKHARPIKSISWRKRSASVVLALLPLGVVYETYLGYLSKEVGLGRKELASPPPVVVGDTRAARILHFTTKKRTNISAKVSANVDGCSKMNPDWKVRSSSGSNMACQRTCPAWRVHSQVLVLSGAGQDPGRRRARGRRPPLCFRPYRHIQKLEHHHRKD